MHTQPCSIIINSKTSVQTTIVISIQISIISTRYLISSRNISCLIHISPIARHLALIVLRYRSFKKQNISSTIIFKSGINAKVELCISGICINFIQIFWEVNIGDHDCTNGIRLNRVAFTEQTDIGNCCLCIVACNQN